MNKIAMVLMVAAFSTGGCGKKGNDGGGATQIGTTGLSVVLPADAKLKQESAGVWTINFSSGGHANITAPYERGMPSQDSLESSVKEDGLVGDVGRLEKGPNGEAYHYVSRSKDGDQFWIYAYIPTKSGAALCEGWSQKSATEPSVEICKKIAVAKK